MPALRDRLRLPLACLAFGAVSVSYYGLHLVTGATAPVALTAAERLGISLPLTVAWFAFGGACMLAREKGSVVGVVASCSRFSGQAACIAGIPVWAYWYLHVVFELI